MGNVVSHFVNHSYHSSYHAKLLLLQELWTNVNLSKIYDCSQQIHQIMCLRCYSNISLWRPNEFSHRHWSRVRLRMLVVSWYSTLSQPVGSHQDEYVIWMWLTDADLCVKLKQWSRLRKDPQLKCIISMVENVNLSDMMVVDIWRKEGSLIWTKSRKLKNEIGMWCLWSGITGREKKNTWRSCTRGGKCWLTGQSHSSWDDRHVSVQPLGLCPQHCPQC